MNREIRMRRKIFISVLMVVATAFGVRAQERSEYDALIESAQEHLRSNRNEAALRDYIKAFRISEQPAYHLYNAACAAAKSYHVKQAYQLLFRRLEIDKEWHSENLATENDLAMLHYDKQWNVLLDSMKIRNEKYESRFDKELRGTLKKILNDDQDIRFEYVSAQIMRAPEEKMNELSAKMTRIDSINRTKIAELFDKYGWLGSDKVGDAAPVQFYILQHAPVKMQTKYKSKVQKGVKCGDIQPSEYAKFEDRIAVLSKKKQTYGTQILYDDEGKPYVAECANPQKVNDLRKKVGLPPMSEYLERWGLKWEY